MESFVKEILLTQEQIARKVAELGAAISAVYGQEEVVAICVLKGAMVFTSDLIRQITSPVILDTMVVSSYGDGTTSSGQIRIIQDCKSDLQGKHVLIIDDIIDTGNTLAQLCALLRARDPRSLRTCAFLDKPSRRTVDFHTDYVGYQIPDAFVIGYGLDYAGKYRALPYVAVLSPAAITE